MKKNRTKNIMLMAVIAQIIIVTFCVAGLVHPQEVYHFDQHNLTANVGHFDEQGVYRVSEADTQEQQVCLTTGKVELPRGVYQVRIDYETDGTQVSSISSETLGYRHLVQNAVTLRDMSRQTDVEYRFMLKRDAQDLKLDLTYTGAGSFLVSQITITHTRQEYSAFLCLFVICMLILDGILLLSVFHYKWTQEQKKVIFGVLTIGLIASMPVLIDYMHLGDDMYFHLTRIEGIAREWYAGNFPSRMQSFWLNGMGYPVSIMYGDIFLWIPAFFRFAGFDLAFSYKAWVVILQIATAAISYISFRNVFKKSHKSVQIGLMGSAIYTLSLYRLYNIYVRGAVGEYTAMTFLPLILWGITAAFSEDENIVKERKTLWVLVLGFSGVLYSHILSLEFAVVYTLVLCLILWKRFIRKSTFFVFVKAALVSILAGLWFLVPFLDYTMNMKMMVFDSGHPIQVLGMYILQLFWFFPWTGIYPYMYDSGMQNVRPYGIGIGLIAGLFFFLYLCIKRKEEWKQHRDYNRTKIAAILGMAAMLLCLNCFPWDAISSLGGVFETVVYSIQFPYRFLLVVMIMLTMVCCGTLSMMYDKKPKYGKLYGTAILALTMLTGLFFLDDEIQTRSFSDLREIASLGSESLVGREYLMADTNMDELPYTVVNCGENVSFQNYHKEANHVEMYTENSGSSVSYIEPNLLYYIGYHAWDQKTGEEFSIEPGTNNVLRILLPQGYEGTIEVDFTGQWYWKMADYISLIVVVTAVMYLIYIERRRLKTGTKKEYDEEVEEVAVK